MAARVRVSFMGLDALVSDGGGACGCLASGWVRLFGGKSHFVKVRRGWTMY